MKSHRRAGWLVGLLVGVSLMAVPRQGAAYMIKWPEPGPPQMGDPDTPPSSPKNVLQLEAWQLVIAQPQFGLTFVVPSPTGKPAWHWKPTARRSHRR